jgi:hypothetical protein
VLTYFSEKDFDRIMALMKCEECGRDVSSKAKACPHCGCPVNPRKVSVSKEEARSRRIKRKLKQIDGQTFTCSREDDQRFPAIEIQAWNPPDAWEKYKQRCEEESFNLELNPQDFITCKWTGSQGKIKTRKVRGPETSEEIEERRKQVKKIMDKEDKKERLEAWSFWGLILITLIIGAILDFSDVYWITIGVIVFVLLILFGSAFPSSGKANNSNAYKAFSVHQRNQQQKELNELNDQVEDMNDRFDGFG